MDFESVLQKELDKQIEARQIIVENWKAAAPEAALVLPSDAIKRLLEYRDVDQTITTLRYALAVYRQSKGK